MSKLLLSKAYATLLAHKWIVFLIWALWLTLEYFALGPYSYVRIHDWGDSILPMWMGSAQGFREYGFSYWSTLAACGFDRLTVLGPLFRTDTLLLFISPEWLAVGLVAFVQCFIAGYFTYRLCRDCLKFGELPSLLAGLAYSACFFYFSSGFAGEAGFPLMLWALERINQRKGYDSYLLAALLGAFVLFSSSFALSIPFILFMALAWFMLVRRMYSLRFLSLLAVFFSVLLAGQIPWIIAALSQSDLSHRIEFTPIQEAWSLIRALNGWDHWVFPFHTKAIILSGLELSIFGLGASRLRGRVILFISALLALALITTTLGLLPNILTWGLLGIAILVIFLFRPVDKKLLLLLLLLAFCMLATLGRVMLVSIVDNTLLSGFQFDRFYLLAPFFAVLAGGYGLNLTSQVKITLTDEWRGRMKFSAQAVLCVLLVLVLAYSSCSIKLSHYREWVGGARYAMVYQNPELQMLAGHANTDPFRVATVCHDELHPAYANAYGLETVDGYVTMYPLRYKQYWGKVIEPLTSVDQKYYDYFHGWGNRIYLFAPSSGEFDILHEVPFADYYNLELLALANTKYLISPLPLSHESLKLVASLPNGSQSGNMSLLDRIRRTRGLYIYENELCLPRFFISDGITVFDTKDDLLQAMAEADIETLQENVFVEQAFWNDMDASLLGLSNAEVEIQMNSPDRIKLSVETDGRGILVASSTYSPYWVCKVNGVEKEIFPVYHTFIGVPIEKGEHVVQLEYCPPYRAFW